MISMKEYKLNKYITAMTHTGKLLKCPDCGIYLEEIKIYSIRIDTETVDAVCPSCNYILAFKLNNIYYTCKIFDAVEVCI